MSNKGKKVIFKQETILGQDGEVLDTRTTQVHIGDGEPSFVKMYLDDLGKISNISGTHVRILYELLQIMDYSNIILLNKHKKEDICRKLDIFYDRFTTPREGVNTVDQAILSLVKAGVLIRLSTGTFKANPFFFAKGAWKDIKEIRLEIMYDATKGRFVNVNIEK